MPLPGAPAFARYFRMDKEKFNHLVGRISIHIQRQDTIMRAAISPGERLAVTLRYLATGETFPSLESQFRTSRTAISKITRLLLAVSVRCVYSLYVTLFIICKNPA